MTYTLGGHPTSPDQADSTPASPVVLRAATRADVPSIVALSDGFVARDHLLPRVPAFFEEHIGELSVAELGTRLVGCVGVARLGPLAVIYNLCVSVTMQGLGVGRLLLAAAGRVGAEAGCTSLLAASKHGGAWFVSMGFSEVTYAEAPAESRRFLVPGRGSTLYRGDAWIAGG